MKCVPSLEALPAAQDLLILSISAAQAPEAIAAIAEGRRAESVILIPGGLDEKPESAPLVARMKQAIAASRATEWRGPVINGGNCLGVRSVPGRYNTLFIPDYKLPFARGAESPLAFIAGSGAFAVAKASKFGTMNPRYIMTIGNQMDLTAADYLEFLEGDPAVEVFAVYVEGFRPLDGRRFLETAHRITAGGRTVLLYRAGRTAAGAAAAASHTAAVAGDYAATRRLAAAAGVIVADTLEDFEDLARLCLALRGRRPAGPRLGAMSNAGFECVAIADNLGAFTLADFSPATAAAMGEVLKRARIAEIVGVARPDRPHPHHGRRRHRGDPAAHPRRPGRGPGPGRAGAADAGLELAGPGRGARRGRDPRGLDRPPHGAALPRDDQAVGGGGGRRGALRPDGGAHGGGRRAGLPRRRPGAAAVQPLGRGGDRE